MNRPLTALMVAGYAVAAVLALTGQLEIAIFVFSGATVVGFAARSALRRRG